MPALSGTRHSIEGLHGDFLKGFKRNEMGMYIGVYRDF